ncbi:MAG: hypothetical protein E4H15_06230 [Syntrophobacterales bacterium]|nr:MAG: hypothetical protein E4H15_06230 [Syntrophobacterales bacterium]
MKEQILLLIDLQNITFEMDKLTAGRVDLPQKIKSLGEELESIERELKEDEERVEMLKADHKAKETALKNSIEQVKKAKGRLLEVKTNKEYEAILKEIDAIQEKNSAGEDAIIHMLEEIDRAVESLKVKESVTAGRRSTCENEIRKMEEELNSIGSGLETVLKRSDEVRSITKPSLLKKFDMIKDRKGGRAVVPVWKAVCYGCHMNIPPQMYNELQRNDKLMLCPHCERIIYWEDRNVDA